VSDLTLAAVLPRRRPGRLASLGSGYLVMAARCLRLSRRNVDALVTSLVLPIVLMVMFVYLFGGAITTGTSYVDYVVPGVLLLCAGFGAANTAVTVCQDMTGGIIDRLRSLDVPGPVILAGHVTASVVRNAVSTALVLGVALLIGFRPQASAAGWLGAAAILLLFILAISWLAAVVGLMARSAEAASGFTFAIMFLPYPSSTFVPITTMPGWLQGFARNQPVTPVVQTLRGLVLGGPVGGEPWRAAIWCGAILVICVVASGLLFRHRTS
jgi:ABC-2 type transport system permease protein